MNEILRGMDRSGFVKGVAVYLVIYAVLNVCAGLAMTVLGGLTGVMGAATAPVLQQSGISTLEGGSEAVAAATGLAALGGLALVWGLVALISVPLFLVVAYGLFQRKAWARMGTVVALGVTILLSLINFGSGGLGNLLWIAASGFIIYMFMTDEGVRLELSR